MNALGNHIKQNAEYGGDFSTPMREARRLLRDLGVVYKMVHHPEKCDGIPMKFKGDFFANPCKGLAVDEGEGNNADIWHIKPCGEIVWPDGVEDSLFDLIGRLAEEIAPLKEMWWDKGTQWGGK